MSSLARYISIPISKKAGDFMKIKEKKFLFGIPSWGLSLLTALLSTIILFFLASFLPNITKIPDNINSLLFYLQT
jgi:hypothetical protein